MELSLLQTNDIRNALLGVFSDRHIDKKHETKIRQSNCSDKLRLPETLRSDFEGTESSLFTITLDDLEITAGPLFPNSLLSTEVFVYLCTAQSNSVAQNLPEYATSQLTPLIDYSAYSPLHYRSHRPLPEGPANVVYRADTAPFVTLFTDTIIRNDGIHWSELIDLCMHCCNRNSPGSSTQRCSLMTIGNTKTPTDLIVECENRETTEASVHLCDLPSRLDQLNIISKSALVLGDSIATAVDSVRSSTAFSFVSNPPPSWEALQLCVDHYIQHQNMAQLIADQQTVLEAILHYKAQNCHIVSHHTALAELLSVNVKQIHSVVHNPNLVVPGIEDRSDNLREHHLHFERQQHCSEDLILACQHNYVPTQDQQETLATMLVSGKRKFRKFQESPRRFLTDSKHWPFNRTAQL